MGLLQWKTLHKKQQEIRSKLGTVSSLVPSLVIIPNKFPLHQPGHFAKLTILKWVLRLKYCLSALFEMGAYR